MKRLLPILMIAGAMLLLCCEQKSPSHETDVWYAMRETIKSQLKNPDSFEEQEYQITPIGNDEYLIIMKFNADNSFGGTILNEAKAKAKWTKETTKIYNLEFQ